MEKNIILFDLDGTLTESGTGIVNSVAYALSELGIFVADKESLYPYIGPPLLSSFIKYFGLSQQNAEKAVAKYREYFKAKGMFENKSYDGIKEMLEQLKMSSKTLIVATSKPTVFSEQILEHFGLRAYFKDVQGSNEDGGLNEKAQVIEYVLETNGITDRDQVVMVGDRCYDILGARECKIASIGVLYGYGTLEEMEKCSPDYIAHNVNELGKLLGV